jgi:hypothetical protein
MAYRCNLPFFREFLRASCTKRFDTLRASAISRKKDTAMTARDLVGSTLHHVFELGFLARSSSTRHKSGITVRFACRHHDSPLAEADRLDASTASAR